MSVLSRNKNLILTIILVTIAVLLVATAAAATQDLSSGPGDWGGTAGNPDDWGKPQPSSWLIWITALRTVASFNVFLGAW